MSKSTREEIPSPISQMMGMVLKANPMQRKAVAFFENMQQAGLLLLTDPELSYSTREV